MMKSLFAITTACSLALITGCAASTNNSDPSTQPGGLEEELSKHRCDVSTAPKGSVPMVSTELIFGLDRKGTQIPEAQFQGFVDTQITPRFPDGFSLIDVKGQFQMSTGQIVREPSKMLIIYHNGSRSNSNKLEELRTNYKQQFEQESVLRTDEILCVAF